jgi:hypothetical protein
MARSVTVSAVGQRGIYFFLSYAHSVITGERIGADTDPSVGKFYKELRQKVSRHAMSRDDMRIGFIDQDIPAISDLKAELSQALGLAEVFVPLYSPVYFANAWSMREREVFLGRLSSVPDADPAQHVLPVLWTPWPSWESAPSGVDDAIRLGADISDYAQNGLRALCMLATYRPSYDEVLDRLARRIVSVVERSPIGPSAAPDLDDVPDRTSLKAAFTVTVLMPDRGPSPLREWGKDAILRRPFTAGRAPAVAYYAMTAAERLGFQTRVVEPSQIKELATSPGIVIVDPWILAEDDGAERLETMFKSLPPWVLPLVVTDDDSDLQATTGVRLKAEAMLILSNLAGSAIDDPGDLEAFKNVIPRVVSKARRTYFRNARVFPGMGAPAEESDQ